MSESILRKWPALEPYVPSGLRRAVYRRWMAFVDAYTNDAHLLAPEWAAGGNCGARFATVPRLPDGFFAFEAHVSNYEHLFVMWQRGGRRFHFYDLYFGGGFAEASGFDLYARAREHLARALKEWETTERQSVVYALGRRLDDEVLWGGAPPRASLPASPGGDGWTALAVPEEKEGRVH